MDIFDRIVLLKNSAVFSLVRTEDLQAVARQLELLEYTKGECIFSVGDIGQHMYLVQSGTVNITLGKEHNEPEILTVCQEGDCFGEMNILDDLPRSASAFAQTHCQLLALEKHRLLWLITSYPELALGMMRGLSHRVRRLTNQLDQERNNKT